MAEAEEEAEAEAPVDDAADDIGLPGHIRRLGGVGFPETGAPLAPMPHVKNASIVDEPARARPSVVAADEEQAAPPETAAASKVASAKTTAETQTQTPKGRVKQLRSPLMPCMKAALQPPSRPAAAPVASKVGAALRKDAALRKQLVAARRRRLAAIVAGASPEDAPIDPSAVGHPGRAPQGGSVAFEALGDDGAGEEEPAQGEEVEAGVGPLGAPRSSVAAGLAAGLGEAEAAILIAQRFLGTSLGAHFADQASGARTPRPFAVHDDRPTAAASMRVTAAAAAAAAALIDDGSGEGTLCYSSSAAPAHAGEAGGGSGGDGALPFDAAVVGERAAHDAIDSAIARFGLHDMRDDADREEAARVAAALLPRLDGGPVAAGEAEDEEEAEAIMEAARRAVDPAIAMIAAAPPPPPYGRSRAGAAASACAADQDTVRQPTAWEVDVSELRKPPPAAAAAPTHTEGARDEEPPPRPPRPPPKGQRRSHADWTYEVIT